MTYETHVEQMAKFNAEPMSRENFESMQREDAKRKEELKLKKDLEEVLIDFNKPLEKPRRIRVSTRKKYIIKEEPKAPRPRYIIKDNPRESTNPHNYFNSAEYQRKLYAEKKALGISRELTEEQLQARRERALKYYHDNKHNIKRNRREYYANLDTDKKEKVRESNKKACQKRIANMTEEQKEERRQAERARRHNMTPEEKLVYKEKLRIKREQKKASMTEEEKQKRSQLQIQYKKERISKLTPLQIEETLEYARFRRKMRKLNVDVSNLRPKWSWLDEKHEFPKDSWLWSKDD